MCEEELKETFFRGKRINTFLSFTLLLPFIFMVIIVVVLRSIHPMVQRKLTESPADHPSLAGFALAGFHMLVFILVMDIIAVHYFKTNNHEYSQDDVKDTFNLFILVFTLIFDVIVTVIFIIFLLRLSCIASKIKGRYSDSCSKCISRFIILPYFYCLFGSKSYQGVQIRKTKQKAITEMELTLTAPTQADLPTTVKLTNAEQCC